MLHPPPIVIDENFLGGVPGGVTHVSPRRLGRPPPYGRRSPGSTLTPTATVTATSSPVATSPAPKASPSPPPTPVTTTASITLRNITSESENMYKSSPRTPQGGFLPVKSTTLQSPSDFAGAEKLVTRLYGQIETQEGEFLRLKEQYQEGKKRLNEEKKRSEQLEKELADAREEIEEGKKRFANYRKQEREMRNKVELDQKERKRDEIDRWDATLGELLSARRELAAKNQKLAEFEFMCMNLQHTLDNEKGRVRTELTEAQNRIVLSSKMLETCHAQLSGADKQLKKEKTMNEVLVRINGALQNEIKRVTEQLNITTETMKQQQQKAGAVLPHAPSMMHFKTSESAEMYTNAIIQDLQIEDALFYFEEVKKHYEDRPKVYRVFLEIIRDYKSRKISTPEVIARISKLFQGNSKLIIGFNRFLPNDFHVTQDDVADLQSYNGDHEERYRVKEPTKAKGGEKDHFQKSTVVGQLVQAPEQTREAGEAEQILVQKVIVVGVDAPKAEEKGKVVATDKNDATKISHDQETAKTEDKSNSKATSQEVDETTSTAVSAHKNKRRSFGETRRAKGKKLSTTPRSHTANSLADLCSSAPPSFTLTISTSSSMDSYAARPSMKRLPADVTDEDIEDNATAPQSEATTSDNAADVPDFISPTEADVASPTFDLNVVSTVGSSHVFGGIESADDSFGVGILSVDQTTFFMPSDRYEVVEDTEYNAIELVAAHQHGCSKTESSHSSSGFYWTHRHL